MTFFNYTEKLETIKYLSELKRTGTVVKLAEKLSVSERTAKRMVRHLRNQGFPIVYNRNRNSYEVKEDVRKN